MAYTALCIDDVNKTKFLSRRHQDDSLQDQDRNLWNILLYFYTAGLEQERTSCVLVETEKIEKQTLHNC